MPTVSQLLIAMPSFEMKFTIKFIALISIAYGANHFCWSVDRIADEIFVHTDNNSDGILTYGEFQKELISDWDLSNDSCLSYHEFTANWVYKFHDHHDTAHAFFNKLDVTGDKQLCFMEVAVHIVQYDNNPNDGRIESAELHTFMHDMHPDSHHNGGHGHGC
ncbi:uncharacterized protein LOC123546469 [Mercenaria mercenaria]|uniref:uncharacterized protein LOC123546469 n=1 Tax=Mercenaria mercenaria TaxID=6596 RepID=UPI00234E76EB|nr:uncharacterized protein LOC123546469 [Mercenaria mercenaria]